MTVRNSITSRPRLVLSGREGGRAPAATTDRAHVSKRVPESGPGASFVALGTRNGRVLSVLTAPEARELDVIALGDERRRQREKERTTRLSVLRDLVLWRVAYDKTLDQDLKSLAAQARAARNKENR